MSAAEELGSHRLRHLFSGLVMEDEFEGTVLTCPVEPLWRWNDLTIEQREHIRQEVKEFREHRPQDTPADAEWAVLSHFAVECRHRWVDHLVTNHRGCSTCGTVQFPPGLVVKVGGQIMRVPEPPPMWLRMPVPRPLSPIFDAAATPRADDVVADIVTYRWDPRKRKYQAENATPDRAARLPPSGRPSA